MVKLSRRRFLFCAPAIVLATNIMPVKALLAAAPLVMMTPEGIAREMARQIYLQGAVPVSGLATSLFGNPGAQQAHVSMDFPTNQLTDAAQFIEQYLRPAAYLLTHHVGSGKIMGGLVFPRGLREAAMGEYAGIKVRYVSDYDIRIDRIVRRFDILHT